MPTWWLFQIVRLWKEKRFSNIEFFLRPCFWRKKTPKILKKVNCKECQKTVFFFGWEGKCGFFQNGFLFTTHYLEKGHFRQHYLLWQNCLFQALVDKRKHCANLGFVAQGKNIKSPFWRKGCFWKGVIKRLFTICDPQKLCSAENTIFVVLSGKT